MAYKKLAIISSSIDKVNLIKSFLTGEEYDIHVVSSEDGLVSKLYSIRADFIIWEPILSSKSSMKNIKDVRKIASYNNVPVLLFSVKDKQLWMKYPLMDFVDLPTDREDFLLRIDHLNALADIRRNYRKQNDKLRQTIRSQEKMISIIAHDLRSPIGTIKMINDAILEEKSKIRNLSVRKKFEMIGDTTEEAYNLLENLLRWSRNFSGRNKTEPLSFDLSLTIREVVSLFKNHAANKNITLTNHITDTTFVFADEDMIKTVLRNLLSNAIKFTNSGGRVDVYCNDNSDNVEIAVKDNGQGMSSSDKRKLLKKQPTQMKQGTKNEKGSGLGLILCRDFVRMNKGHFYFDSKPGEGSTFYFTVPKPVH
ncbi:MAG: hybrid sensor histidine kinase/response regulator [Culturomica sp.]|jgi:two-component system sensor histidine kinase/response regulator|nr:hybrid sensor histidine kinase/response regulator [Culturomica sp.]